MLDRYVCTRVKSESPFDCVDPLDHAAATDSKATSDIAHSCDVCDMFQSRSLPQKKAEKQPKAKVVIFSGELKNGGVGGWHQPQSETDFSCGSDRDWNMSQTSQECAMSELAFESVAALCSSGSTQSNRDSDLTRVHT